MDVLIEEQHRALAFIAGANAGGYAPVEDQVEKWLSEPTPANVFANLQRMAMSPLMQWSNKSTTAHLVELGWVTEDDSDQLRLTPLGEALLRNAEAQEAKG